MLIYQSRYLFAIKIKVVSSIKARQPVVTHHNYSHLLVFAVLSFTMREGCMDKVKRLLLKVVRMKKPVAHIAGVEVGFEGFRLHGIILKAKISVTNPYGRLLPISVISYTVKSADRLFTCFLLPAFKCLSSGLNL